MSEVRGIGEVPPPVRGLLLSRHTVNETHEYDPLTDTMSLYHSGDVNDVDCNPAEGSDLGWYVEHTSDDVGTFEPGTGVGLTALVPDTAYDYPKHVAVFGGEVLVMSRNDCMLMRYDTDALLVGDVDIGCIHGQGIATDGSHLFVSTWSDSPSLLLEFDADLALVAEHANPIGLSGDNLVDLAYDARTSTWWGMVTSDEAGTGTRANELVEFTMSGSVLRSVFLDWDVDGIGLSACP